MASPKDYTHMKTFDQVGELDKLDPKAFEISNVNAKEQLAPSISPDEVYAPNFNPTAFNAQLDNAYRSTIEANLSKPEEDNPTLRDTMKAAFETGNTIGSALSSQSLGEWFSPTKDSPELTDDQIAQKVGQANLMPYLQHFQGVTNQAQFDARLADIQREQQNQKILEASGLTGTVAMLAAGIVDLPTLLPVGKAFQLGKEGASLLESAGRTAAAGLVDAGISEAGLQSTQQLRTGEEGVINVASGGILGAVLGAGVHTLVGREVADKVEEGLDAYRKDALNAFPEARANVDKLEAEIAQANGLKTVELGDHEGFTTAKGSTYIIQADGTTIRNKAARADVGHEGDSGIKPASQRTVYVTADAANEIGSLFQATHPEGVKVAVDFTGDGRVGVRYLTGKDAGKFEGRTASAFKERPEVGLTPVELWNDGKTVHFGNAITALRRKAISSVEAAPAPTGSSVGATFSDIAAEAAAHGKRSDAKVAAFLLDKIPSITTAPTEFLSKIIGGKTLLGRPREAFRSSALDTVRQFSRMFYSAPEISEANALGQVGFKGMTVEDHIGEDLGKLAEFKSEVNNIYAKNKSRFRNVNDLAEQAYYAALNEGIDTINKDPAIEAVARAFNKYADYQHAKHVANGRLPENTPTMGTPGGYVHRAYNQTALRNNEATAREMLYQWAQRKITQDVDELDAETGYSDKLARYEASKASHPERVKKREEDFTAALADWKETRDNLVWQDTQAFERDTAAWRDRVAEFLSDPKNEGKKHPYGPLKPKKKNYDSAGQWLEENPRPRKGPEETITEGNAKPPLPKTKFGMPLVRQDIPEQARILAEDVYNTLAGVKSSVPKYAVGRVGVRAGYLKGRVVDIPDDVLGDNFFLKTNLIEHADAMHYTSGRDAAMGSVFKTVDDKGNIVGDYDGNSIIRAVEEEADAVINETTGEAKTKLIEQRDRMLNGIQNEIAIARGNFDVGSGLIGAKAAHYIASAAYGVRLGGVTISSLTDAPAIAIANGLGNTFRYGILPMLTDFRAAVGKNGVLHAQGVRTGNVVEVLHNTRMADAFELHNPYQVGSKFGQFVDKATKLATQVSLISHWTDFGKQVAHNIASSRMLGYAEIGWDRLSQKNRAWLANLGLDAEDMAKVKAEYADQDLKHVAGVLYADLDKWKDQDLAARFAAAFRREGRNVVVAPGLGDRPQFSHTPEGKLINQFQTFMLSQQVRFFARQAQLANVGTDASEKLRQQLAFGAGMSSLVLGAVLVDSMKRALRDDEVSWDKFTKRWSDNPGGSMYDAIDRAGLMGSLFTASNTVGKFSNGVFSIRGGTQWLAGDKDPGDARKVRDIGLGGALFGPAAGMAEDAVKGGQALAKAATGGTLSRADLRRFQNLVPYHAVPGIQQGMNAVNNYVGTQMGLPPEVKNLGH